MAVGSDAFIMTMTALTGAGQNATDMGSVAVVVIGRGTPTYKIPEGSDTGRISLKIRVRTDSGIQNCDTDAFAGQMMIPGIGQMNDRSDSMHKGLHSSFLGYYM